MDANDAKLKALLQGSRLSPDLPPRFRDGVWRRIEDAEAPKPATEMNRLDAVIALILRPRFAFAAISAFALAGILIGTFDASKLARQDAEARYVASVAPAPLR